MEYQPSVSLDEWLINIGFVRGNPFASQAADQERGVITSLFVEVPGYNRIKSDQSIITYADRGCGKSALRIAYANQLAPLNPISDILAIEYIDFGKLDHLEMPSIDSHINRILRLGCRAMLEWIFGKEFVGRRPRDEVRLIELPKPEIASAESRAEISIFLRTYYPDILESPAIFRQLKVFDPSFAPSMNKLHHAIMSQNLSGFLSDYPGLATDEDAVFWGDIVDAPVLVTRDDLTAVERLRRFIVLLKEIGLNGVSVLIDRIDEMPDTAARPDQQISLISSIIGNLNILEMPRVTFKIFLAREAYENLLTRIWYRPDRLRTQLVTVSWSTESLKGLLDRRLAWYSNNKIPSLLKLWEGAEGSDFKLHTELEVIRDDILTAANGSPRRLLRLMELLCQVHVEQFQQRGIDRLTSEAWAITRVMLDDQDLFALTGGITKVQDSVQRTPAPSTAEAHFPTLNINIRDRRAYINGREVPLTPIETKFLLALAEAPLGFGTYDSLLGSVYSDAETYGNATVSKNIARIREKITAHTGQQGMDYLETRWGQGFQLRNYSVVADNASDHTQHPKL